MDLVATCKDKLQYFRIKELKDVLTQLGLSKQGKKQDLVDRILAILAHNQVSKMWAKIPGVAREEVVRLVNDAHRKRQISGVSDMATKGQGIPGSGTLKPNENVEDSFQMDVKVRCPCGDLVVKESMIRCADPKCQILQHMSCVVIPENPMDGIPLVPPQIYCELCRMSRADPFWSTVQQLICPVKLTAKNLPNDGTNPVQEMEKAFHLTSSNRELLSKPEFAVQVWCMLLNDKVPFRMQWPQYAELQVNGVPVQAINRPGSQLLGANGRDDGPNIKQYTRDGSNKIYIAACDARIFCVGVRLVRWRSPQQIMSMILNESDGESYEDALARVHRCVGGGSAPDNADSDSDLEVIADSFNVNLRCPMTGSRMKIAGRFKPCDHLGCFDLESFVEMQQRSRKWQCPICMKNYSMENIIVDPYFNRITTLMQFCDEETAEIEVKPDGSWRVKSEHEQTDLRQWHLPDGSFCLPKEEEVKNTQAGTSLKLEARKNVDGVSEVNRHGDARALSSSDRVHHFENGILKVIPLTSSATGSGKDDENCNQGWVGNFDLTANNGREFDSISLNLEQTYGFTNQNTSTVVRDTQISARCDSGENRMISNGPIDKNGLMDNGFNFTVSPYGISGTYQEGSYQDDPDLGAGVRSRLDLFDHPDNVYGMPVWSLPSSTQGGSHFQLFGSDGDCTNTAGDSHISSVNCKMPTEGYMFPPDAAAVNPAAMVPCSSLYHSSNDLNDGLLNNPLTFGGDDPALQIFLPTEPSDICGPSDTTHQQDMNNSLHCDDWISLRLGNGDGGYHGNSIAVNGLDSVHQLHSSEEAMDSYARTVTSHLGSTGSRSEKTRERSNSPFSVPHQNRSVRQRLHLNSDSD